jgi:MoaA/NifB/PqqE/SkfB family radical SAM enzyme
MTTQEEQILAQYDVDSIPFVDGAIRREHTQMHSWRYFLEINSACNLKCPTCTKGNMAGFDHKTGHMDPDLMEEILDKIKSENPQAIVFVYGNSEPFLHPKLPECIAAIRSRGLHPEMSTNLNYIQRVEDTLNAHPDLIIISLSGFTQEVYVRGHAGGNVEKVKANMRTIAETNNLRALPNRIQIKVNYHVYDYNHHEIDLMAEYAKNLGIGFFTSIARAISMENSIQYCRSKDPDATPFEIQPSRPDWNEALPPVGKTYSDTMDHLRIPPDQAREMYKDYPISNLCPVGAGSIFTFIRHDGKTQLCACTADRRINLTDYLETTPQELMLQRVDHAICKQCIKYRLNLYFMIADRDKWNP